MSRLLKTRHGAVFALAMGALAAASFALYATASFDAARPAVDKPRYGFGRTPTPQEIAAWDIDVRPDGKGLPPGRGTVAEGKALYDAQCASCHGSFGESNDYMVIAGGVGTLASDQPIRTTGSKLNYATTLWDYINRAMPFQSPKTLAPDEVYALTAYVLYLSDILPADASLDHQSLVRLELPNRDGFTTEHGLMTRDGKGDTRNVACMRDCAGEVHLVSEIPDYARDAHGNLALQMRTIGPTEGLQVGSAAGSAAAAKPHSAGELAKLAGCTVCHGVANRLVGPAFKEIEGRYGNDAAALAKLTERVKSGGSGVWGQIPMPPQPQVQEADAKAIVQWILAGAP